MWPGQPRMVSAPRPFAAEQGRGGTIDYAHPGGAVRRATILRATGAASIAVGQATIQLGIQALIQRPNVSRAMPTASNVETPETRNDIMPLRMKAKRKGAKRCGIMCDLRIVPRRAGRLGQGPVQPSGNPAAALPALLPGAQ